MFILSLSSSIIPTSWKHTVLLHQYRKFILLFRLMTCGQFQSHQFYPQFSRSYSCLFCFILHNQNLFYVTSLLSDQLMLLLYTCFHNVTHILETIEYARCFLIGFSKAFDSVSHSILLDKLAGFACQQIVISWLVASY
jgi:hypothetical protein